MRKLLLIALLPLAACSTMTDVAPIGEGRYMVGNSLRGGTRTDVEVKAAAVQKAIAYCKDLSKEMVMVSSNSSGTQGWTVQNAEVIFKCA